MLGSVQNSGRGYHPILGDEQKPKAVAVLSEASSSGGPEANCVLGERDGKMWSGSEASVG